MAAIANLDYETLVNNIPTSYATCSMGTTETPLEEKLRAIAGAGFSAIELAFPDLLHFVSNEAGHDVSADDYPAICKHASRAAALIESFGLKVLMLQPFANYEGWPKGSKEREDAWKRVRGWREIMSAVGTDMLQVGSSDSEGISGDKQTLASDLRELADFLAEKSMRVCYENWCWATHAPDWEDVWELVKLADRSNIGLCLDTFQSAGGEWADPTTNSGRREDIGAAELEKRYEASVNRLARTVPKEKIFLLQISDAYKPPVPLGSIKDETGTRPRGRWSHDFRPMPYDGGYLPIIPFTKAVLQTGFQGWFSMEIFDGGKDGKGKDFGNLGHFASRAMESHRRLIKEAAR